MASVDVAMGALKYATDNFDNEDITKQKQSMEIATRLKIPLMELKQLRFAQNMPDDERSIPIKNKVADKVASSIEIKPGGGLIPYERFTVKNLIDEDVGLQKAYLERKGYQTKEINGKLQVRKPDDFVFQPIDPSGIDRYDMLDIVGDVIKGTVEGIGQGSKVLGAAVGGLPGLALGTGVSAGLSAATETARQGLGIAAGVRPSLNYPLIAKEAAIGGAVGGTLKGIGQGAKYVGEQWGISGARNAALKPNADEIIAAAKEVGGIATPGRISASQDVQKGEDALARASGFLGLNKTKKIANINYEAEDKTAKAIATMVGIAPETTRPTVAESGKAAIITIRTKIKDKVDEASKIYNEIESKLNKGALKADLSKVEETIESLKNDYSMDDAALAWLASVSSKIKDQTLTIGGLKKLKTAIGNDLARHRTDPAIRRSASTLLSEIESAKSATFESAVNKELQKLGWKPGMTPEQMTDLQFEKGAQKITYFTNIKKDLEDANKLWREANIEIAGVMKRPGEDLKGGVSYNLEKLMKAQPEKIYAKVLSKGDAEKGKWLIDNFPAAADAVRKGRVAELQAKLEQKIYSRKGAESTADSQFATRFINALASETKENQALILGVDAAKKFEALKTFANSKVKMANPSGTASMQIIQSWWKEPVVGLVIALKQANMLRGSTSGSGLRKTGAVLTSPVTRGVLGGLIPEPTSKQPLTGE